MAEETTEYLHLKERMADQASAYGEAIRLLQARIDRQPQPEMVMAAVQALSAVSDERFIGIALRFTENKTAVDAALSAAKESNEKQNISNTLAISKSEAAMTERVKQMESTAAANTKAQEDRMNDLKERITIMESLTRGQLMNKTDNRSETMVMVSVMGLIVAVIVMGVSIVTFWVKSGDQPIPVAPAVVQVGPAPVPLR